LKQLSIPYSTTSAISITKYKTGWNDITTVFYARRLFEKRKIDTLVYLFRMMRELGCGENANNPIFADFMRMDRVMEKMIERRTDSPMLAQL
jgi:hypothetical protein